MTSQRAVVRNRLLILRGGYKGAVTQREASRSGCGQLVDMATRALKFEGGEEA